MSRLSRRRVLRIGGLVGLVGLAGCSGSGDGSEPDGSTSTATATPTSAATETATATERPTQTATPAQATDAGTASADAFSEGAVYRYTLADQSFDLRWEVTDVSEDAVTAKVAFESGENSGSWTVSGAPGGDGDTIFTAAAATNNITSIFASLRSAVTMTAGHALETGNTWEITAAQLTRTFEIEWDTATVTVTGTESHAGVSCQTVQVTPQSNASVTFCVNPEFPFAIGLSSSGSAGYVDTGRLVLTSFDR
jgi:hypothetical protein